MMSSRMDRLRQRAMSTVGLSDSATSVTLTIKSTPAKSAESLATLAVRRGYMTKRNEQGQWQRRLCLLVPHTLLYYFDPKDTSTPRGIIDTEWYTNVTAGKGLLMQMAGPPTDGEEEGGGDGSGGGGAGAGGDPDDAGEVNGVRTFYFQVESEGELNDWISAIHRERYHLVREERDAYQELQSTFSGQLFEQQQMIDSVNRENEGAQRTLQRERNCNMAAATGVRHILAAMRDALRGNESAAGGEDAESSGHEPSSSGSGNGTNHGGEATAFHDAMSAEELQAAEAAEAADIAELTKELSSEERAEEEDAPADQLVEQLQRVVRAVLRREAGQRKMIDELRRGLEATTEAAQASQAHVTELSEQKKLLIKEVKHTRKIVRESKEANEKLSGFYETLKTKYETLAQAARQQQTQFKQLQQEHADLLMRATTAEKAAASAREEAARACTETATVEAARADLEARLAALEDELANAKKLHKQQQSSPSSTTSAAEQNAAGSSGGGGKSSASDTSYGAITASSAAANVLSLFGGAKSPKTDAHNDAAAGDDDAISTTSTADGTAQSSPEAKAAAGPQDQDQDQESQQWQQDQSASASGTGTGAGALDDALDDEVNLDDEVDLDDAPPSGTESGGGLLDSIIADDAAEGDTGLAATSPSSGTEASQQQQQQQQVEGMLREDGNRPAVTSATATLADARLSVKSFSAGARGTSPPPGTSTSASSTSPRPDSPSSGLGGFSLSTKLKGMFSSGTDEGSFPSRPGPAGHGILENDMGRESMELRPDPFSDGALGSQAPLENTALPAPAGQSAGEDANSSSGSSSSTQSKPAPERSATEALRSATAGLLSSIDRRSSAPAADRVRGQQIALPPNPQTQTANKRASVSTAIGTDGRSKLVVRCQRCGGTVEGPKYSTCSCDVPLLDDPAGAAPGGPTTEADDSAGGFMSGLLERGKDKALALTRRAGR